MRVYWSLYSYNEYYSWDSPYCPTWIVLSADTEYCHNWLDLYSWLILIELFIHEKNFILELLFVEEKKMFCSTLHLGFLQFEIIHNVLLWSLVWVVVAWENNGNENTEKFAFLALQKKFEWVSSEPVVGGMSYQKFSRWAFWIYMWWWCIDCFDP